MPNDFKEMVREGEREERNTEVREKHRLVAFLMPSHPGTEPTT